MKKWLLLPFAASYVWMPGHSCKHVPSLSEDEIAIRARLREHIAHLSQTIGERYTAPQRLAAAQFIQQELTRCVPSVIVHEANADGCTVRNIIAEIAGRTPRILVIGAHYDTVRESPGANDNASGVAVLLELARLLQQRQPACTVRLVAFDNEEHQGQPQEAQGSFLYAAECRARGDDIIGMWSLETLAYFSDEADSQHYLSPFNLFYPTKGNFVAFIGNDASARLVRRTIRSFRRLKAFPSEGIAAPEKFADIGRSDHWGFWRAGYPALMITDTANFRYPFYHTPDDRLEKLSLNGLARVTRLLADVAVAGF